MAKMSACYGDADDKPSMKGSKEGLSSKGMMKGGTGAGVSDKPTKGKGRTAQELHHHNRPHGMKGPSSPEGY